MEQKAIHGVYQAELLTYVTNEIVFKKHFQIVHVTNRKNTISIKIISTSVFDLIQCISSQLILV